MIDFSEQCVQCKPTSASSSISIEHVPSIAATLERSQSVDANLITAISVERTLIDVYGIECINV